MELKEKLLSLPTQSGCYIMKNIDGNVIYVGKAKNLKRRVNSYFNKTQKNIKTENLVENIVDFDFIVTNSEYDCLILENNLIKKYKPHYNILLKDDKNFPYIKVDLTEDFPMFEITRKIKNDNAKYFGPYFLGINAYEILDIINFVFSLKTCKTKFTENKLLKKSCLNYSLSLCSAPCINKISKEIYRKNIFDAIDFLKGNTEKVEIILQEKMIKASENLNFERAIKVREQLKSLEKLKQKSLTQFVSLEDCDVINSYDDGINCCICVLSIRNGKLLNVENFITIITTSKQEYFSQFIVQYYSFDRIIPKRIFIDEEINNKDELQNYLCKLSNQNVKLIVSKIGDKKKLLKLAEDNAKEYLQKSLTKEINKNNRTIVACERLKDLLKLKHTPYRMECYDISHISGTNKVASMVVFQNGEPLKSNYRKFIIKSVEGNNDFASLHETLLRRIDELKGNDVSFSKKPDLIIIDGGKGQLSSTAEILENNNLDIDIISLAKRIEEVFIPHSSKSIILKHSDVSLQLLQRIRDEAHRFAITFHRSKRNKTMFFSELDSISGLGKERKKLLIKEFGSVENIKKQTKDKIYALKFLPKNVAVNLCEKLNIK